MTFKFITFFSLLSAVTIAGDLDFRQIKCTQRVQKFNIVHNAKLGTIDVEMHMFYTSFLDGIPLKEMGMTFRKPSVWDRLKHRMDSADIGIIKFSIPDSYCTAVRRNLPDTLISSLPVYKESIVEEDEKVLYLNDEYLFVTCKKAPNISVEFASAKYNSGKLIVDQSVTKILSMTFLSQLARYALVSKEIPTSLDGNHVSTNGKLSEIDGQLGRAVDVWDQNSKKAYEVHLNSYGPIMEFFEVARSWRSGSLYPLWISYEACIVD